MNQNTNSVNTHEVKNDELEALTNALNFHNLTGYKIHEWRTQDKRNKVKKYFVTDDKGVSITGGWDYISVNHFILGYGQAYNKTNAAPAPSIQSKEEGKHAPILPSTIALETYGRNCVAIFKGSARTSQDLNDQRSLFKIEHFEGREDEKIKNEAIAARIVQCWNEHDGLKAENEKLKQQVENLLETGSSKLTIEQSDKQDARIKELEEDVIELTTVLERLQKAYEFDANAVPKILAKQSYKLNYNIVFEAVELVNKHKTVI